MAMHGIEGIGGAVSRPLDVPAVTARSDGGDSGRFDELLAGLSDIQAQADAALTELAVGGEQELHDVVLAVEMESIAFELAVQIRNRLVEAYQEIFRMSV